jgi:hypothetical protein
MTSLASSGILCHLGSIFIVFLCDWKDAAREQPGLFVDTLHIYLYCLTGIRILTDILLDFKTQKAQNTQT